VSPSTLSKMLKDTQAISRFSYKEEKQPYGIQRLALCTAHGEFQVEANRTIDNDDLVFIDIDGAPYSYKEHYTNEMVEKIILGGNSGEDTPDR
jgi:hypothetical protein